MLWGSKPGQTRMNHRSLASRKDRILDGHAALAIPHDDCNKLLASSEYKLDLSMDGGPSEQKALATPMTNVVILTEPWAAHTSTCLICSTPSDQPSHLAIMSRGFCTPEGTPAWCHTHASSICKQLKGPSLQEFILAASTMDSL